MSPDNKRRNLQHQNKCLIKYLYNIMSLRELLNLVFIKVLLHFVRVWCINFSHFPRISKPAKCQITTIHKLYLLHIAQ